jgi:phosphopantetheine--protein transferase-like protein
MISNGIDLIKINRFKDLINNKSFMAKNFNESEIEYINKRIETLAGLFAAKEALLKSLKKGINNYSLKDIEIIHDSNKAPSFIFHNKLKELNINNISLSISHDGDYAIAIVSIIK